LFSSLLAYQMNVNGGAVLAYFPLIIEFKKENDRQFDHFASLFVVSLRGSLPNGPVAFNESGFFNVRPVAPLLIKASEELLELLAKVIETALDGSPRYPVRWENTRKKPRFGSGWRKNIAFDQALAGPIP
jgi:hypothetical protein